MKSKKVTPPVPVDARVAMQAKCIEAARKLLELQRSGARRKTINAQMEVSVNLMVEFYSMY